MTHLWWFNTYLINFDQFICLASQSRLSEVLTFVGVDFHYIYRIDFQKNVNISDSRLGVDFPHFSIYSGPAPVTFVLQYLFIVAHVIAT